MSCGGGQKLSWCRTANKLWWRTAMSWWRKANELWWRTEIELVEDSK